MLPIRNTDQQLIILDCKYTIVCAYLCTKTPLLTPNTASPQVFMQHLLPRWHPIYQFLSIPCYVHKKPCHIRRIYFRVEQLHKNFLLVVPIIVCITLEAAVPPFVKMRQLLPDGLLVEASTERAAQTPMLFLGDIVFTFRFG